MLTGLLPFDVARMPHTRIVLLRAVREVASPVAAGVLIIVTVFLPLLTLQNLEGKFFVPVALTIVFALAGSLPLLRAKPARALREL